MIVNMRTLNEDQLVQAAQILTDSLAEGWPTLASAMSELAKRMIPENTLLAAVEQDQVVGFGGILPIYGGHVFELHPLAVRSDKRGQGIGSRLVRALEQQAAGQGGLTIWLGADDDKEGGETSLANVDLYDGLPQKLADFTCGTHQSAFYCKLGYRVLGVLPNANGRGKPDIFLGKDLCDVKKEDLA